MLVLLPHREARDAEVVGDIADDQCDEPCVCKERDGEGDPDDDGGVSRGSLEERGTKEGM